MKKPTFPCQGGVPNYSFIEVGIVLAVFLIHKAAKVPVGLPRIVACKSFSTKTPANSVRPRLLGEVFDMHTAGSIPSELIVKLSIDI